MTITETRPEPPPVASSAPDAAEPAAPFAGAGLAAWVTTADHRRIGRLYVGFSLLFLLAALVLRALLSFERVGNGTDIFDIDGVFPTDSLASYGLVFLAVVPLLLGLVVAVVPLQVGARGIAFPRAAALSFWAWLVGSGLMIGAFIADGGPGGSDADATDLFLLSFIGVAAALTLGAVCVATTVLTLRAPGMSLDRVPFFSWTALVWSVLLVLSLPVLGGLLALLYVDHHYGVDTFGGDLGLAEHLRWAVGQPQVYLYALPVLGFLADVVLTFARTRRTKAGIAATLIGLAGVLGFGAWAQPSFRSDGRADFLFFTLDWHSLFWVVALAAVLPPVAVLGWCGLQMRSGRPRPGAPLVFGVTAWLLFAGGAAAGALRAFRDLDLEGTVYEYGYADALLFAGVLAGLGALTYWGPKLWGRRLPDVPAGGLAVLALLGAVLAVGPNLVLGFLDQPLVEVNFDIDGPRELLNVLAGAGYAVLFLVVLAYAVLAVKGFGRGELAGDDPWDGSTLEWATTSPPPPGNFTVVPVVDSPEPLLDRKAEGPDRTPEGSVA